MDGGLEDRDATGTDVRIDEHSQGLEDFATLAETYLLEDPTLAHEFPGVNEEEFEANLAKAPADFLWEPPATGFRTSDLPDWEAADARQVPQLKAIAETKDSSEWEQTREQQSRKTKSESPQSGHLSATSTPMQSGRASGQKLSAELAEDMSNRPESPFIPRLAPQESGHSPYDLEKQQHLPQSFSRLLNSSMQNLDPAEDYDWPPPPYPSFPNPPYPRSVFTNQPMGAIRSRGSWAGSDHQDQGVWAQMRPPRTGMLPHRNSEQPLDHLMDFNPLDRAHSMGDVMAMQRPPANKQHMRSRAGSCVTDMPMINGPKGDLQMMSSPFQPETPADAYAAERKRKRPADQIFTPPNGTQELGPQGQMGSMSGPSSYISSTNPPIAHHDLIRILKSQIEGVDLQTKSILKDTLYRISRHTNVANGGAAESRPRQSNRSQYLDKLVANFLYNRFEYPDPRQRIPPYPSSAVGGYGVRGGRIPSAESMKPILP